MKVYAITTINSLEQLGRIIVLSDDQTGITIDYSTGEFWDGGIYNKVEMGSAQLHERAKMYDYIRTQYGVDYDTHLEQFKKQMGEPTKPRPASEEGISDAQE